MTITWYGQSCFRLETRGATLAIDPFSKDIGLTPPRFQADIVLVTHTHPAHANIAAIAGQPLVIAGPGEYETSGVSIRGLPAFHDSHQGRERGLTTIYRIEAEGLTIVHLGDFGEGDVREETAEALGAVDVLLLPVGGTSTIGGQAAARVTQQIEPRLVVPMHYRLPGLTVKLSPVEEFLKAAGVPRPERLPRLALKKKDLPDGARRVIILQGG